jgi:hypothetical protein
VSVNFASDLICDLLETIKEKREEELKRFELDEIRGQIDLINIQIHAF